MVYLEKNQLGWLPLIQSFMNLIPEKLVDHKRYIEKLLIFFIDPSLDFILKHGKRCLEIPDLSQIRTLLNIFNGLLKPYRSPDIKVKKTIEDTINNMLLFSLIWSLGAVQSEGSRKKFSEFIK